MSRNFYYMSTTHLPYKMSGGQKQYHNIQVNIQHTDTDYQEY